MDINLNPRGVLKLSYKVIELKKLDSIIKSIDLSKYSDSSASEKCVQAYGDFDRLCVMALRGADNLKTGGILGKECDAYATITWNKEGSIQAGHNKRTPVATNSLSPVWLQNFVYLLKPGVDRTLVTVKDKDLISDDFRGRHDILLLVGIS